MFRRFCIIGFLLLHWVFSSHAFAAEDPDELYRKGRFAEAQKAYAGADMDHPKDIRYRYNRGCAAYQNSDYKEAVAAFSSVMRRAKTDETRFRAAYNLGNTAFKKGDFASASSFYKKALLLKPASQDARYNLELTLRELEKQKKRTEQQKEKAQQRPDKAEDKGKGSEPGKKEDRPDRQEGNQEADQKPSDSQKEKSKGEKDQSGQEGEQKQEKDDKTDKGSPDEKKGPEDLSGELKPREGLSEDKEKDREPAAVRAMMDRKKAEALLDNIQEDPARFFRYQIPKDKRRGVKSGKEW